MAVERATSGAGKRSARRPGRPGPTFEGICQALGDPTRIRILGLLLGGEVCVCDIHEALRIPQPKASRHLAYLKRAGLVQTRREGSWIHYRVATLEDPVLATLMDAAVHCLTHLEPVRADRVRLARRTPCCSLDSLTTTPRLSCCETVTAVPVALTRSTSPADRP